MKINKELFKSFYFVKDLPDWICPACNAAVIRAKESEIKVSESVHSKSNRNNYDWNDDWFFWEGAACWLFTCSLNSFVKAMSDFVIKSVFSTFWDV